MLRARGQEVGAEWWDEPYLLAGLYRLLRVLSRPTLLLLPGLLNDAELWRDQVAALSDVAHCVVGDLTGSDSLRGLSERLLATMPERFALAGFSLGGYVAQDLLRIGGARVQRLALLDTSARADTPERVEQRRAQEASVRVAGSFHGFGESLMRRYVDPSRLGDQALLQRVRGMTQRLGPQVFLQQSQLARGDGHAVLRQFRRPMLVLWGEHDLITPPKVHQEILELAPHARGLELSQCGHLSPLEKPREVSAALRQWLLAD